MLYYNIKFAKICNFHSHFLQSIKNINYFNNFLFFYNLRIYLYMILPKIRT